MAYQAPAALPPLPPLGLGGKPAARPGETSPEYCSYTPATASAASAAAAPQHDLWVVGAGTLGGLVAQEWARRHPSSSVVAETATTARHDLLRRAGAEPRLRGQRGPGDRQSSARVLVCLPPSGAGEGGLPAEIEAACSLLAEPPLPSPSSPPSPSLHPGVLLYTSSTAVYGDSREGEVNEDSALDLTSPRAQR
jgi:hypothetical protein